MMNLGIGGVGSSFPFNSNSGEKGWFPISSLITTSVSLRLGHSFHRPLHLLFRSSLYGYSRRGCFLKQFSFSDWLSDALPAARTSGLCFFNGKSFDHQSGKGESSPQKTSNNSSFFLGRWTNALLAVNVLLYVAQIASKGKLMLWGAKINSLIDQGQLWRLFTSSFLHANLGHLMINCYSLNSIGPAVENICGTGRYFTIYFASAITSSAMSYWLCQNPAIGASGAIFGLVGSVAMFSLRHRNLLPSSAQNLQHIAQVILLNLLLESGKLVKAASDELSKLSSVIGLSSKGIDNWGHLGGLLGGVAVSWLIGPAWTYDSTTRDGRKVFVDKAPIGFFSQRKTRYLK